MGAKDCLYLALTVDIVGSQKIEGLRQRRDEVLDELSERHLEKGWVLSRYTVTAWDEFQNVLAQPWHLPDVVWDLRLAFRPVIELKIGAGLGELEEKPEPDTPLNREASGEAFLRAREAMDHLLEAKDKYQLRTAIRSDAPDLDRSLNLIYMLVDSLISNLSERQWETIKAYTTTGSLDAAAKLLEVNQESTVSRNLHRGFYWQLKDARGEIRALLESHLHQTVQET